MINSLNLRKLGLDYYNWSKKNPIGKIPLEVAKEGAGENRIPFAHYANSLPVYLLFSELLKESEKEKAFILDIGCGTGRSISFVKDIVQKRNYKYYGIDYSEACIKYGRQQYKKQSVEFIQHEGKILPFPDKSFDFIISSHVIEHILKKNAGFYLAEISRVLKKDGIVVIGTPNRKYCQDLFLVNPGDKKKYRLILPHEHEYYYQELKNLFRKNGRFNKLVIYGTTNLINRQLITSGAEKIRPKEGILHKLKFSVYSYLRSSSRLQDIMARVGTEYILKKMKVSYKDIIENTSIVQKNVVQADNFIIVAS